MLDGRGEQGDRVGGETAPCGGSGGVSASGPGRARGEAAAPWHGATPADAGSARALSLPPCALTLLRKG
jgi:hypothetical protein